MRTLESSKTWYQSFNLVCSLGNEQGYCHLGIRFHNHPQLSWFSCIMKGRRFYRCHMSQFHGKLFIDFLSCRTIFFHAKHPNIIVSFPLCDHDLHNIWTTATITSRTATSTTTIPLHFLGKRDVSLKCQSQAGRSSIPGFRDGSKLDKHRLDFPCFFCFFTCIHFFGGWLIWMI